MGIPYFFRHVLTSTPDAVRPWGPRVRCHKLYLDFNSIVHQCAGEVASQVGAFSSRAQMFDAVFDRVLHYTYHIARTSPPSDLLYIAVDGTCPRSKMAQQRKRRFMASWRSARLPSAKADGFIWESNMVTPGTEFMTLLDERLQMACSTMSRDLRCNVVVSPSTEFGEGEHKIIDGIIADDDQATFHVVYGLDADLILLSLLQGSKNVWLMREAQHLSGNNVSRKDIRRGMEFNMLNIPALRASVAKEMEGPGCHDAHCLIRDYVMLCSLLGNDFVPGLSYLKIRDDGMHLLLSTYKGARPHGIYLTSNTGIDFVFLGRILAALAASEPANMAEAIRKHMAMRYVAPVNSGPGGQLEGYPLKHPPSGALSSPSTWRDGYYPSLFRSKPPVSLICEQYVDGLYWIYAYYIQRVVPKNWYYGFNYSPLIVDIVNYITMQGSLIEAAVKGRMERAMEFPVQMDPELHLIAVLPPANASLIPREEVRRIVFEPAFGVQYMFPWDHTVDTFLKSRLWECYPVLPPIDLERLDQARSLTEGRTQ